MAGKNQHFIPRFLQNGFCAPTGDKETYLYHKTRGIRPKSTRVTGAENYFYSRPSLDVERTLDDIITDEEAVLTKQMDYLRELPIGAFVDANIAAEMVAHFSVRTRNFREFFGTGGDKLVEEMSDAISDAWNVARLLGLDQPSPNDLWREFFEKRGDGQKIVDMMVQEMNAPKVWVERFVFMAARELIIFNHSESVSGFLGLLQDMRFMLKQELPKFHSAALLESRKPQKRLDALTALHWQISSAPDEGAILPDCVVLGRSGNDKKFASYVMASGTDVEVIVMPISSRKMLVGVRQGATLLSMANFNNEAAANSAEFFVASVRSEHFEALLQEIGTAWSGQINDLIDYSIGEYRPIPTTVPIIFPKSECDPSQDEEDLALNPAAEITRIVNHYYKACPRSCNLERLEGITFATDLNAAFNEISLGSNFESPAEKNVGNIILGVAIIYVRRGDELKIAVLLSRGFYDDLISNWRFQKELASAAVLACLCHVSALSRIEAELPGFMLAPVSYSDHDALVHCAIRSSIRAYWAGRDVAMAGHGDALVHEAEKFTLAILISTVEGINHSKAIYADVKDKLTLFTEMVSHVSEFLFQLAQLIGLKHGSGIADEELLTSELVEALRPLNLETWVSIYGWTCNASVPVWYLLVRLPLLRKPAG